MGVGSALSAFPGVLTTPWSGLNGGAGDVLEISAVPSDLRHPTSKSTDYRRWDTKNRNVCRRDRVMRFTVRYGVFSRLSPCTLELTCEALPTKGEIISEHYNISVVARPR